MTEDHRGIPDATLYRAVVETYLDTNKVTVTAKKLGISEVRVRKVLLTEGLWSSKTSVSVQQYLAKGRTTEEIANLLQTSVKAVQQYVPYSRGLYGQENRSASAQHASAYRERIRLVQEKVLKKNKAYVEKEGWSMQPLEGTVCLRELPEEMQPERSRLQGVDIIRLHLELMRDELKIADEEDDGHKASGLRYAGYEEETRVLRSYGGVKYGETISRDILIPSDMPLYALHYMIQQAFGWQNSHLHCFELPFKRFLELTDNSAEHWMQLCGVLFRSPWMEEGDEFWADDYEKGSFKAWMRKKYTGRYLSLCHGEGIIQCREDIKEIKKRLPMVEVTYTLSAGKLWPADVRAVRKGTKTGEILLSDEVKKDRPGREIVKAEVKRLQDCTALDLWKLLLEGRTDKLLERLPLEEVLALHAGGPEEPLAEGEEICTSFEEFMDADMKKEIREIIRSGEDYPDLQPMVYPVTDVLYYNYDYGDNWYIKITGSMDANDLVAQGRITQREIDQAIRKIHETYRPVCIAADGLPLVDDAGGISGYIRFLRSLHPAEEKEYWGKENTPDNWAYETKTGSLKWAKSLGWKEKITPATLL